MENQTETKQFKLGPLQEKWVKSLEDHPERQMSGRLGTNSLSFITPEKRKDIPYMACCLGQAQIIISESEGKSAFSEIDGGIVSHNELGEGAFYLEEYSKIGLKDRTGSFANKVNAHDLVQLPEELMLFDKAHESHKGNGLYQLLSLSSLNDNGWTWTELASLIRKYPTYFFNKSV